MAEYLLRAEGIVVAYDKKHAEEAYSEDRRIPEGRLPL
jgi:hypothetical protein